MPSVMWFRRDLRLLDNPALIAAVEAAATDADSRVVPLFVVDPTLWEAVRTDSAGVPRRVPAPAGRVARRQPAHRPRRPGHRRARGRRHRRSGERARRQPTSARTVRPVTTALKAAGRQCRSSAPDPPTPWRPDACEGRRHPLPRVHARSTGRGPRTAGARQPLTFPRESPGGCRASARASPRRPTSTA